MFETKLNLSTVIYIRFLSYRFNFFKVNGLGIMGFKKL